ncbi:hypothetical protein HYH03_010193 [Edaphochlamys debaryana]|uniref:Uncharacterized protein n=1 Tax=Edaphochlamys debaryana TaxID=47281 RepID=A0A835XUH7_9CHLO|nr:hypothetical protein HYH03_010193 [Edaphochlamys debaryana]|eukprot:KAG2491402.1 hypothetical protein HYH03_010193 [Edaphochlamys debaryana]
MFVRLRHPLGVAMLLLSLNHLLAARGATAAAVAPRSQPHDRAAPVAAAQGLDPDLDQPAAAVLLLQPLERRGLSAATDAALGQGQGRGLLQAASSRRFGRVFGARVDRRLPYSVGGSAGGGSDSGSGSGSDGGGDLTPSDSSPGGGTDAGGSGQPANTGGAPKPAASATKASPPAARKPPAMMKPPASKLPPAAKPPPQPSVKDREAVFRTLPFESPVTAALLAVVAPSDRYIAVEINRKNTNPNTTAILDLGEMKATSMPSPANSFCGAPVSLPNGDVLMVGGHKGRSKPSLWDGRDKLQTFSGSTGEFDIPNTMRWKRWYPSAASLADGKIVVVGGTSESDAGDVPPFSEVVDPDDLAADTKLLKNPQVRVEALTKNFVDFAGFQWFPFVHALPKGHLLWWGDRGGSISDVGSQEVLADLPNLPESVKHHLMYPYTASVVLLAFRPEDDYTTTMVIIGGGELGAEQDTPASSASLRLQLRHCADSTSGYCTPGWEVEDMEGIKRVMGDGVVLPNGKVYIVNGAHNGRAGYLGSKDGPWSSYPANTVLEYNPYASAGKRYKKVGFNPIPRTYHSTACLHRTGEVLIAGCDTCGDVIGLTKGMEPAKGMLEHRLQLLTPGEIGEGVVRPVVTSAPEEIKRDMVFQVEYEYGSGGAALELTGASLVAPCARTHSIGMNQRVILLETAPVDGVSWGNRRRVAVKAPPSSLPGMTPPGYYTLYLLGQDGTYSVGVWVKLVLT